MGRKNKSNTAVDKIEAARAAKRAFELRVQGHDWIDICEQLDVRDIELFKGTVWQIVRDTVTDDERQALKAVELARLERLHNAYWDEALGGAIDSAEFILKVSKQRAALMGLNSPTAIDVKTTESVKTYVIADPSLFDAPADSDSRAVTAGQQRLSPPEMGDSILD
jgi:hypothetical protein